MYSSSRIWMSLVAFLCIPVVAFTQPAGQNSGQDTLTLRLVQKRDHYPFQARQTAPGNSAVVLVVELTNTGARKLDLVGPPEPELQLTGPGAASVRKSGGHMFYAKQEQRFSLNPGETRRLVLRQLSYRADYSQFHLEWTQQGKYSLKAIYPLSVVAAEGAVDPDKADAGKGGRQVTVASAAVTFEVRAENVVAYWGQATRDPDEEVRRTALITLAGLGQNARSATPAVVRCLEDMDPTIREQAIRTLEAFGPPARATSTPVLLKALKDSATEVRCAAVAALAAVAAREQDIAPALVPLLKDRDPQVRMAVAAAFRRLPFEGGKIEPTTLAAILNALRLEAITEVRGRLIGALCHSPDLSVVRELVPYLQSNIPGLREQALESMSRIAPFLPNEVKKGKDGQGKPVQEAVAALTECLNHQEYRGSAAHVLMYLGPDAASAVPALIDAINQGDNQADSGILHSRVQLIQALGGIGPSASGATRTLALRLRTDPDYSVRQYAAEALGRIGPQAAEAVPELRQALKDKAVQVRDHAAPALGLIGPKAAQAIPDLLQTMRTDKSNQTRWLAAHSLTQIGMQGQKSAVPMLTLGLADADVNVVFHCAVALGQIGPDAKAALPALERVQQNPRVPLQDKITEAIDKIRGTSKQ